MAKSYAGKHPDLEDGWFLVGTPIDKDGVQWAFYAKKQAHTPDWITCKVCAQERAENKANYWMVKNLRTGQIGFAKDFAIMRDTRPDLHAKIEFLIEGLALDL